jgi:protein SCO1/2
MMKMLIKIIPLMLLFTFPVFSQDKKIDIGIDEQLGKKLPVQLEFYDEAGNKKPLKDFINGPTLLAFVYYQCPGICSPLMSSIAEVVNDVDLKPGESYNIVTLSFDENETPEIASDKKKNFLKIIGKEFPETAWRFLTGDSSNIKTITDAAGFYFKREGTQFIHSGAVLFISKEGKICRYLFPDYSKTKGYSILPFDFKMAISETSQGKATPTIARVLQFCFSYDPKGKTYVLNFTRIFGAGILLMAVVFVFYLRIKPKKSKQQEVNNGK